MNYRLLVDLDVIEILDSLPRKTRAALLDWFGKLRQAPEQYSDFPEYDGVGRRIEVSVFAGCAIHYWIDPADKHIKILAIRAAGQ